MNNSCANSIRCAAEQSASAADAAAMGQDVAEVALHDPKPCLSAVELFQDIPPAEMAALNDMLPLLQVQAGEIIYDPAKSDASLFIVKSGRVRVFQLSPAGKAFTIAIMEPGHVFGQMPLLGQTMGSNFAEAMETAGVCRLSEAEVTDYFLNDPRIARRVAQILGHRVQELETRLADLALKPLSARIAAMLLQLSEKRALPWNKQSRIVRLTHEQLAGLVGATREAVSKILSEFASQGLITQGRGRIIVVDTVGLEQVRAAVGESFS